MITDSPRKLGFRAFWRALWDRPRSLMFGLWFVGIQLLFFIPFSLIMMTVFTPRQPDHAKIRSAGHEAKAEVVRIETVHNVSINGVNPRRIFFQYEVDGRAKNASMDTMSIEEITDWKSGRQITIRYLGNEATIPSLQPVDFPDYLFLLMPLIFSIIGLPFLLYSIAGARRKLGILRNGVMRNARLLSLAPISSLGIWFNKTRFEATYVFSGSDGKDVFGKSLTTDLVLLNEKKKGDEIEILVLPNDDRKSLVLDAPTLAMIESA